MADNQRMGRIMVSQADGYRRFACAGEKKGLAGHICISWLLLPFYLLGQFRRWRANLYGRWQSWPRPYHVWPMGLVGLSLVAYARICWLKNDVGFFGSI